MQLRKLFKTLGQVIARSPTLARHAHFVLVPGPDDPSLSAADVVPRSGLPRSLTTDLTDAVKHCELATSPARLVLCGQHIVIHRDELMVKARRACVMPPSPDEPLQHHLVKTLIDQAHLCPLPPTEVPRLEALDLCLPMAPRRCCCCLPCHLVGCSLTHDPCWVPNACACGAVGRLLAVRPRLVAPPVA